MTELTRTLFGRSDLELILSSPVSSRSLLGARALAIAMDAVASVGLILVPLADVAALRIGFHWLALYPALIAAGLFEPASASCWPWVSSSPWGRAARAS